MIIIVKIVDSELYLWLSNVNYSKTSLELWEIDSQHGHVFEDEKNNTTNYLKAIDQN